MENLEARLSETLREAGMSEVPAGFSVALLAQEIPATVLAGIDDFVRVFDRVTTRQSWQDGVTASAPEVAKTRRSEVCFFSAWDFHMPADAPDRWQLIEFNDNGSGFLFAALIDHHFFELSGLGERAGVAPPPTFPAFTQRLLAMVEAEATHFFGELPSQLLLVLDDPESLAEGKFRDELFMLRDLLHGRGWQAEVGSPGDLRWDGRHLLFADRVVSFVVNRSTDFLWAGQAFTALRAAYKEGRVYVAPNPFTYATRSDKQLLELLSRPDLDRELGIQADERALLAAHVPETWLVSEDNLEELVRRKEELVFKPARGFASRGLLPSSQVGRRRLRRLLGKGEAYVAQRRVAKRPLSISGADGHTIWADLRVWAYRGERYLLSGRASRRPDALDLRPPGGWLPTYAATAGSSAAGR